MGHIKGAEATTNIVGNNGREAQPKLGTSSAYYATTLTFGSPAPDRNSKLWDLYIALAWLNINVDVMFDDTHTHMTNNITDMTTTPYQPSKPMQDHRSTGGS